MHNVPHIDFIHLPHIDLIHSLCSYTGVGFSMWSMAYPSAWGHAFWHVSHSDNTNYIMSTVAFTHHHGLTCSICAMLKLIVVVNVGLGTYIFDDGLSDIFFVYVGYTSFIVILFGVMFLVFSITATFVRDPG